MMRTIYLEGELGDKFGTGFQINAPTVGDAIKCIDANYGNEFRKYLLDCHEKGTGFTVDVADNHFDYETEMLMELHEGDITITPMPAGSKSAFGKILAAIAIIVIAIYAPQLLGAQVNAAGVAAGVTSPTLGAAMAGYLGTGWQVFAFMAVSMALNLAMMGIMQMMAPDPATDQDGESTYLFNGAASNVVEGDPVPVLYGRLRVPGQPVGFEMAGRSVHGQTAMFNHNGATGNPELNTGSWFVQDS